MAGSLSEINRVHGVSLGDSKEHPSSSMPLDYMHRDRPFLTHSPVLHEFLSLT